MFYPKKFLTLKLSEPKFFMTQNFFRPIIFSDPIFFYPKFFWTQKSFVTRNWLENFYLELVPLMEGGLEGQALIGVFGRKCFSKTDCLNQKGYKIDRSKPMK